MLDVELVLHKLSEMGLVRLNKINGDYYSIYCPIHKDGQERKPSCGVLLHDQYKHGQLYPAGWCHCFTCGYAKSMPDLITDLFQSRNISGSGLGWLKENVPEFDVSNAEIDSLVPSDVLQAINTKYALQYIHSYTSTADKYVDEEELAKYRYTVPYMYERKLTDDIIEKYDIGFDPYHVPPGRSKPVPCITFPVRDINGKTLFICRRSIEGKYFNLPYGVEKPVYGIYELPKNCSKVVICESFLNALTCVRYGSPAVALLGTGTPYQMNQLRQLGVKEFICGLDSDEAGRKGTAKLKRNLKDVAIVWEFEGIPLGKDINDLSEQEFRNLTLI